MRDDQHIHDIHSLYLFMEKSFDRPCIKCKLFQDNFVGSMVELYEEFVRENLLGLEEEEKRL